MKKTVLILSVALIQACSTSVYPTYTSEGQAGYRLVCGGAFGNGDLGGCYQEAGQLCTTNGFRVLQTSVSSLLIECRNSKDVLPDAPR